VGTTHPQAGAHRTGPHLTRISNAFLSLVEETATPTINSAM
jgi:hypothetical protein